MKSESKVLIVDDNVGDIRWLLDFVESRGYQVDVVGNEEAARGKLEAVYGGREAYALAILDVMVAIKDIMEIDDFDDSFYDVSKDTGVRLCRYVRRELRISAEQLPIVCISGRDDDQLKDDLAEFGIRLFGRSDPAIRNFLRKKLPEIKEPQAV